MTITIRLKTDNAAFADDKSHEVRRILREWLRDVDEARGDLEQTLIDVNGNRVGSVTVRGK